MIHIQATQEASPAEMAFAAAAFLCASVGATLTVLGAHIFDRVEVSARWAVRRAVERIEELHSAE